MPAGASRPPGWCRHQTQADAPLLRAALGGGAHAMEVLYDRHAPLLYRLAVCLVGPAAAEPAVVYAFVDAFTRPDVVSRAGGVRAQLVRLTVERCRAASRR